MGDCISRFCLSKNFCDKVGDCLTKSRAGGHDLLYMRQMGVLSCTSSTFDCTHLKLRQKQTNKPASTHLLKIILAI